MSHAMTSESRFTRSRISGVWGHHPTPIDLTCVISSKDNFELQYINLINRASKNCPHYDVGTKLHVSISSPGWFYV